jgi:hypothetical protein
MLWIPNVHYDVHESLPLVNPTKIFWGRPPPPPPCVEFERKQEDGQKCVLLHSLILKNILLTGTFGLKKEEVKGDWTELHLELHNLYPILMAGSSYCYVVWSDSRRGFGFGDWIY